MSEHEQDRKASPPAPQGPLPSEEELESKTYRFLVVDDDEDIRRLLSHTLVRSAEFRCTVDTAEDAPHALALLEKNAYDAVLSDQIMPEENGIAFLMEVKDRWPATLRFLITAHTNLGSVLRAVNLAQVHSYIEKPFDPSEVNRALVEALLRRQRRLRGQVIHISQVQEALRLVRDVGGQITNPPSGMLRVGLTFSFQTAQDFNRFTFEIMRSKDASIGDVHVFEGRFHVTVAVGTRPSG